MIPEDWSGAVKVGFVLLLVALAGVEWALREPADLGHPPASSR